MVVDDRGEMDLLASTKGGFVRARTFNLAHLT